MRILAVDVGTGTQDILLFDSQKEVENCFKMVMPSPTVLVAQAIREATARGEDLLLTGVTMGGGPCAWAANDHLEAGFKVYATPAAARTFDDDLARVEDMGVRVIGEDEAEELAHLRRIEMKDFDYQAIAQALGAFQVDLEVESAHPPVEPLRSEEALSTGERFQVDALAVAVFDHGHAPPGVSDRLFRFEYLAERLRDGHGLAGFAFWREEIPPRLTRLQAVADTVDLPLPLLVMDTGPAAVLGALEDPQVRAQNPCIVVNIGNFHTLAFHLADGDVAGLFEHHTGRLSREELERYLVKLAQGTITNQEVFDDMGHGALVLFHPAEVPSFLAVTGPRRGLLRGSSLPTYQAVPHGDMMLAGCFGLIRAFAIKAPEHAAEIEAALGKV